MYNIYFYDSERDAIVVTDMDGKQLVIDCKKAEAQVLFDEPEDAGILARLLFSTLNDTPFFTLNGGVLA